MTRFARGGTANKKKPEQAASWKDLKKDLKALPVGLRRTNRDNGPLNRVKSRDSNYKLQPRKFKQQMLIPEGFEKIKGRFDDDMKKPTLVESIKELDEKLKEEQKKLNEARKLGDEEGKKDKRREVRRLKRKKAKTSKMVCFHCRETGHGVADCPQVTEEQDEGVGMCFRCGSTEHDISRCKAKVNPLKGEVPFAKCFICEEMGHLAKSCPDNPKGLYPLGGGCKTCGSVEHRWWNCSSVKDKDLETAKPWTISTIDPLMSADAVDGLQIQKPRKKKKTGPKIVTF
ncbi:zinc finger CCHC domain-containing protein 9-like [Anneissia japonica]|uniref:zinc finger CCHC domain-containing protein 9-like n=1 Tax=Anneissia japonica TaxID=1529436 RepID=UPI001425AEB6|nr:zinc finger CCHC domain-containing protein 9-like [Anneissia japonica]XP_033124208.1 zinc finger CCHC domain-containing protein 9-like [Anneissia japonica]XP_033124210.1 zinc finger CCHC domain-containing protein 9-like [Anneissia japonica]XP_033124211.1 zinc finger CCHC domain-containing protein 9-like [Anneissia japonica]XP_033124212.1 zinc finger CCHC domain-containing protein 9-like [Anneissia japonica]